jgi:protein-tyrosine phosphatase
LTPAAQSQLLETGVRTIIDLRSSTEIDKQPNVFAHSTQVRYLNIPFFPENGPTNPDRQMPDTLGELYCAAIDFSRGAIKQVFDVLTDEQNMPALVHCTGGKDRTGMITALALGAVGVSQDDITADYALTGQYLQPMFDELRADAARDGRDVARFEAMLLSEPSAMHRMLDVITARFGNVRGYLLDVGVSNHQLSILDKLLRE